MHSSHYRIIKNTYKDIEIKMTSKKDIKYIVIIIGSLGFAEPILQSSLNFQVDPDFAPGTRRIYEGSYGGNVGGALGNAASGVVNTAAGIAGGALGGVAGAAEGLVNGALNGALQGSGALNGGLGGNIGLNGGIGGNIGGGLVDLAGGIFDTAGRIIGGTAGAITGAINGVLGGALGGALNTVLRSGVGGIITVDNTGRGCTAKQISGIIQTIFRDMNIFLQECRSDYDCSGIAKQRCGILRQVPNIGSVCLFS
ncbi:hypothetical protein Avbf_17472 [Armadillidium vulgare]|nr:hypothetical protein Avbf_17472 [Armadillidium vulgare]